MALCFTSFFTRDSNRCVGDSNRSISITLLEFGFESLDEGFESPSLVWTFWNVDSNRYLRDSNRLLRICLKNSRIEGLLEGFESPLLRIRIWTLENSSKCSFVKIFLGIFIYILKHLLSLISKHNMSVLVSSKSTRVQQGYVMIFSYKLFFYIRGFLNFQRKLCPNF